MGEKGCVAAAEAPPIPATAPAASRSSESWALARLVVQKRTESACLQTHSDAEWRAAGVQRYSAGPKQACL
ncbi:MAG: hypothetical protein JWM54_1709 [Acidobacteriaceae bacterium]|jgi:hypothetical protein|nr:hypothetical protein [Acidobacteriaceae bacterium]